jgi:peptide/nickel transport system substrate-binding protein
MTRARTLLRAVAITGSALALALGAAGCNPHSPRAAFGGAGGEALHVVQARPDTPTGNAFLARRRPDVHLDPQRDGDREVQAFAQIFLQRSLNSLRYATPGNIAGIVPDLALTLGRPDRRRVTWTYTLRPHVRLEDGSPVTAGDVRYGISRLYARELRSRGLDHVRTLLAVPRTYPGPYAATPSQQAAFDRAVEASRDGMTLTFHLRRPAPDFDLIAALPAFGPVLRERDTRGRYDRRPLATGPYRISRQSGQALVLVPNPTWSPATDALRRREAARVIVVFADAGAPTARR